MDEKPIDPMTRIERLAMNRAKQIIASWWYEDIGEYQEENELTDEEMNAVLAVPFVVALNKTRAQ